MYSFLLAIIYAAFISLGLPDSLLGSGWPAMRSQMSVPISYAGIISMIISAGTIAASLSSDRLTKKFGAGIVAAASVFTTAAALWGFSLSSSFAMLCLWAVPYGLGAGAVDAALNNYVAVNYASRHMSWLHCSWGVGAAISPYVMSFCLTNGLGWNNGYRIISVMQLVFTAMLFLSLPLWKRKSAAGQNHAPALKLSQIINIRGVKYILLAFFGYSALETTTGLWASSYLVSGRGVGLEVAAKYASFFYLGITAGRFVSGFAADKLGDRRMIKLGIAVIFIGLAAAWLPIQGNTLCLYGLIIIGLGCAPIYPAIIHSTPGSFGAENSQAIVGVQMASAYTGSTLMPPLFGLIANYVNIGLYPAFLVVFAVLMLVMTQRLNKALGLTATEKSI